MSKRLAPGAVVVLLVLRVGASCKTGKIGEPAVDCPQTCNDGVFCTSDTRVGDPANCTAACVFTPITACINGDGCCAAGCDTSTDSDCSATCGDGVVDAGEACDGNCPTTCDDGVLCTKDTLVGSASNCSAQCSFTDITTCDNGDGCCPAGCANDNDCGGASCVTGVSGGYAGVAMSSQTGSFEIVLTVVPQTAPLEAGVGLAGGTSTGLTWSNLATVVRFNPQGLIDVMNSALPYQSLLSMAYAANTTYRVREVVNVATHTYSVFVKAGAGAEETLATEYAFRVEQQSVTSLDQWGTVSDGGVLRVCLVSVTPVTPGVTVTVTPPSPVTVQVNANQQFTATVTGSTDMTVTWKVDEASGCGSVTAAGLYKAPAISNTCHVTATSNADRTKSATATVNIQPEATGTCSDNTQNNGETDVDCGGDTSGCSRCAIDRRCGIGDDCASLYCASGLCQPHITGTIRYVAPDDDLTLDHLGDDTSGDGSIDSPWFTLNKAWAAMNAGDVVYMRGGTYHYSSSQSLSNKSGSATAPLMVWSYPGEAPVIDGGSNSDYEIVTTSNVSYLYMKGIRITNLPQPNPISTNAGYYGLRVEEYTTNTTFELIETDRIGGWGVTIFDYCSDILFLNCDSHHNADPYTETYPGDHGDNYGGSDGFETGYEHTTNVTFRGCRAWWNSDDGWDLRQAHGLFTIENCWAFWNGNIPGTFTLVGNGEGFKLGHSDAAPDQTAIRRIVRRSLSFENQAGVEAVNERYYVGVEVYNSVFYKNTVGFNFQRTGASTTTLRNNISYANSEGDWIESWVTHDHNNWDIPIDVVPDRDFQSVSSAGMDGPRQADGSLPVRPFLRLKPGSFLIDAGVDVGLPYSGAPDLGAYESP